MQTSPAGPPVPGCTTGPLPSASPWVVDSRIRSTTQGHRRPFQPFDLPLGRGELYARRSVAAGRGCGELSAYAGRESVFSRRTPVVANAPRAELRACAERGKALSK